ncbi:MAG: 50S ribosomal protein L25/general stress protein Ctc [Chlorobi bacterium]|nr:50S ribosomal protein L25/general stress protein Ctc [Chlorobiota bacterium]
MKSIEIKAKERKEIGKKATKKLRKEENVPCVLYGQDKGNIHFYAHKNEFRKLIFTPNSYIVNLDIDGKKCNAIMQSVDFHPVTDEIQHIDFYRIDTSRAFKIPVPVRTSGLAKGVKDGGVLQVNRRKLLVKATAENMPDYVDIDVTNLGIGEAVRINDLNEQHENLQFLDPQSVVVTVNVTRLAKSTGALAAEEEGEEGEDTAAEETTSEE